MRGYNSTLILDIDYTLNVVNPEDYIQRGLTMGIARWDARQWNLFEEVVFNSDTRPNEIAQSNFHWIRQRYDQVMVVTGRIEWNGWREHTERWLNKNGFAHDLLLMRPSSDTTTPSGELKVNLLKPYLPHISTRSSVIVDDDSGACTLFRRLGFAAFQSPGEWSRFVEIHRDRDVEAFRRHQIRCELSP